MIIRAEQFQTLEAYGNEAYALEVADHLKSFAPPLCKVVGDAAVLTSQDRVYAERAAMDCRTVAPWDFSWS